MTYSIIRGLQIIQQGIPKAELRGILDRLRDKGQPADAFVHDNDAGPCLQWHIRHRVLMWIHNRLIDLSNAWYYGMDRARHLNLKLAKTRLRRAQDEILAMDQGAGDEALATMKLMGLM